MRLIVIGNGMVGARFVEDLLARDTAGKYEVTVIGEEACEPYNRVLLSEVVAGRYELSSLTLPSPDHPRLTVLRGTSASSIDREDRVVVTIDGSRHRYDQLVIATGAAARIPPLDGLDPTPGRLPRGVHALRSIDDAREIVAATLNSRRAVVLGAGVLGIEAASGLAQRGCTVTLVHPADALMERQLDGSASSVLASAMPDVGITPRVGVGAAAAVVADGRLTGIRLTDGEVVESDLLLVATGTIANTAIARDAGLACERGIVVDDASRTADRRIFAIGDCAQPPSGAMGLVALGWDQARRLADLLTSASLPSRDGGTGSDVVRVKAHGLDVVTMGVCGGARPDAPTQRSLTLSDPATGRHVEVVVEGDRLVGATCIGAGQVAADLVATYTRRTPVPSDPAHLLLSALSPAIVTATSPDALADDAAVCRCNSVTKADITSAHTCGSRTVEEVAQATRATTGCGGCTDEVCALIDWLNERDPAAVRA
ncbi:FAD-dependent oxidoreductase [Knoellia subterranea]|uniref:FAD-dependent pyridine nucleotide-disulfide oxidoreductase n=1 Tax=Knoellia subterranea KCTC 19937 TaxID=1385521 RepID=A0A0A0JU78_9MICO|nr:FAD-dependent oxidoreductase [Knoellia subterranea]KGN39226.1 FAD-dependent pyridine nucleotide-disulfide oxidoreductase [Knoellia subterranea KCTC 19937]